MLKAPQVDRNSLIAGGNTTKRSCLRWCACVERHLSYSELQVSAKDVSCMFDQFKMPIKQSIMRLFSQIAGNESVQILRMSLP
jgi:hypothetical protein